MKIQDIDMQAVDIAIQSLKGEREDNDQFNAGMYYIRDLIEPYYNNLVKENKRLNNIIDELEKDLIDYFKKEYADRKLENCNLENCAYDYALVMLGKLKELKGSD